MAEEVSCFGRFPSIPSSFCTTLFVFYHMCTLFVYTCLSHSNSTCVHSVTDPHCPGHFHQLPRVWYQLPPFCWHPCLRNHYRKCHTLPVCSRWSKDWVWVRFSQKGCSFGRVQHGRKMYFSFFSFVILFHLYFVVSFQPLLSALVLACSPCSHPLRC